MNHVVAAYTVAIVLLWGYALVLGIALRSADRSAPRTSIQEGSER